MANSNLTNHPIQNPENNITEIKREAVNSLDYLENAVSKIDNSLSAADFEDLILKAWTRAKASVERLEQLENEGLDSRERLIHLRQKIIQYIIKVVDLGISIVRSKGENVEVVKRWIALGDTIQGSSTNLNEKLYEAEVCFRLTEIYSQIENLFVKTDEQVKNYEELDTDIRTEERRRNLRDSIQHYHRQYNKSKTIYSQEIVSLPNNSNKSNFTELSQKMSKWDAGLMFILQRLQRIEDLITYMASEEYGKQYAEIVVAEKEGRDVEYFSGYELSSRATAYMNPSDALEICIARWQMYSQDKYKEYIVHVETHNSDFSRPEGPYNIDPRITREYLISKKQGELRPLSEVSEDTQRNFVDVENALNNAASKVVAIENEILKIHSGDNYRDLRNLDDIETRIKSTAPCLINQYCDKRIRVLASISEGLRLDLIKIGQQFREGYLVEAKTESRKLIDRLRKVDRQELEFIDTYLLDLGVLKRDIQDKFKDLISNEQSNQLNETQKKDLNKLRVSWEEIGSIPFIDSQIEDLHNDKNILEAKILAVTHQKKRVELISENSKTISEELEKIKKIAKPTEMLAALNKLKRNIPDDLDIPNEISTLIQMAENLEKPMEFAESVLDTIQTQVFDQLADIDDLNLEDAQKIQASVEKCYIQLESLEHENLENVNVYVYEDVLTKLKTAKQQIATIVRYLTLDRELSRDDADLKVCKGMIQQLKIRRAKLDYGILQPKIDELRRKYNKLFQNEHIVENVLGEWKPLLENPSVHLRDLLLAIESLREAIKVPSAKKEDVFTILNEFEVLVQARVRNLMKSLMQDVDSVPLSDAKLAYEYYNERFVSQDESVFDDDPKGALHEAHAWDSYRRKDYQGAYESWNLAELAGRANAEKHRLALLKLLAIKDVMHLSETRWINRSLEDVHLAQDPVIIRLGALCRMRELDMDRERSESFLEQTEHTAAYMTVLNELDSILRLQDSDSSSLDQDEGLGDYLRIWADHYQEGIGDGDDQIPEPPSAIEIKNRVVYRQEKFPLLAEIFRTVNAEARLIHIYSGRKRAENITSESAIVLEDSQLLINLWHNHRGMVEIQLT